MKKYNWIISLLLALSVVIWPVYTINNRIVAIESLYKDSDTISRTVEACGTATVSEVPVGKPNIGWNEFCGLIGGNSQVSYYIELDQDNQRTLEVQALTKTSTGFVLITSKEIRLEVLESIASFGLNDNTIFYTTQQINGMAEVIWIMVIVVYLLVWWFLNWIVSLASGKLDRMIYLRHANSEKRPRAKGGGGMGN